MKKDLVSCSDSLERRSRRWGHGRLAGRTVLGSHDDRRVCRKCRLEEGCQLVGGDSECGREKKGNREETKEISLREALTRRTDHPPHRTHIRIAQILWA